MTCLGHNGVTLVLALDSDIPDVPDACGFLNDHGAPDDLNTHRRSTIPVVMSAVMTTIISSADDCPRANEAPNAIITGA